MIDKILNWQSGSDIEEWEKTLLESKNPRNLYIASHYIKDLDIEKIENELLNLQDEKYLHNFFRENKVLNNMEYLKRIIDFKDPRALYNVAYEKENLNTQEWVVITEALIDIKNDYYINKLFYFYFIILKKEDAQMIQVVNNYLNKEVSKKEIEEYLIKVRKRENEKYSKPENFTNNSSERSENIVPDMVVLHFTSNARRAIKTFYDPESFSSCHFVIDEKGNTWNIVPLEKSAWAHGTSINEDSNNFYKFTKSKIVMSRLENANDYTYSIILESFDGKVTEGQYQSLIDILKEINNFSKKKYNKALIIDREHIVGYNEINSIIIGEYPYKYFDFKKMLRDLNS